MFLGQQFVHYSMNFQSWRSILILKSGVLTSATWSRGRHDLLGMYIVALTTSGRRSWPQELLLLKLSNDSRLTPPTSDSNNPESLTPSKLLLSRPNVCFHSANPSDADIHGNKRWKQAQYLADIFWRRWLRDYLPTLQVRQKWLSLRWNLKIGDLILVIDESAPRGRWPKSGRVRRLPWSLRSCTPSKCQNVNCHSTPRRP